MPSVYDLKPAFQNLLRPVCRRLAEWGVTANQVTLGALALSLIAGAIVALAGAAPPVLWLVPVVLFLRMALNAIDGMLAREHGQASRLGALLNELADLVSDVALYLPFALILWPGWIVTIVILALIVEAAGILGPMIGASRRYDGPFGKSDRALIFSSIAVLIASGTVSPAVVNWFLPVLVLMAVATVANRALSALAEDAP